MPTGYVGVNGDLGIGMVGGDFQGTNDRINTARFTVAGDVTGKLSVGGSLIGADRATSSSHLDVQGYAKEISISGSIVGGSANDGVDTYINSGSVTVNSAGKITVQGSLVGGHQSGGSEVQNHGAIRVATTIDSLSSRAMSSAEPERAASSRLSRRAEIIRPGRSPMWRSAASSSAEA